jgi:hypothetical protein
MIYHTRGEHTNHYTTDGVENNIDDIKSTKTIVAIISALRTVINRFLLPFGFSLSLSLIAHYCMQKSSNTPNGILNV